MQKKRGSAIFKIALYQNVWHCNNVHFGSFNARGRVIQNFWHLSVKGNAFGRCGKTRYFARVPAPHPVYTAPQVLLFCPIGLHAAHRFYLR